MRAAIWAEFSRSLGESVLGFIADLIAQDFTGHQFLMLPIIKDERGTGADRLYGTVQPDDILFQLNGFPTAVSMLGNWYARVRESYEDAYPATTIITQATDNMRDDVLLTRRGNTIYVHLYKDMQCSAVILKPLNILPTRAELLNDGRELETRVDLLPSHHRERPYLRISGVPVNEYNHEVMVIRLDFDESVNA